MHCIDCLPQPKYSREGKVCSLYIFNIYKIQSLQRNSARMISTILCKTDYLIATIQTSCKTEEKKQGAKSYHCI